MFSLDSRSREPIYVQLEKEIVKYINLGVYEVRCRPSARLQQSFQSIPTRFQKHIKIWSNTA